MGLCHQQARNQQYWHVGGHSSVVSKVNKWYVPFANSSIYKYSVCSKAERGTSIARRRHEFWAWFVHLYVCITINIYWNAKREEAIRYLFRTVKWETSCQLFRTMFLHIVSFPNAHVRAQLTRGSEDTSPLSALSMQISVGGGNSVAFSLFEFEFALTAHNLVKRIWGSP